MSKSLQLPGAPSYASRLRGEAGPHNTSKTGKSGGIPPSKPSSAKNNGTYNSSNAGKYLPNTPSSLGMYSQAHNRTPKSVDAERRLPSDDSWKDKSSSTVQTESRLSGLDSWKVDQPESLQTSSQGKQNVAGISNDALKPKSGGQQDIMDSVASLSISLPKKAEAVPEERWKTISKVSKHLPRSDRDYLKSTPSPFSISYRRTGNQTPMEQATHSEYLPFRKSEYKVGMIIRMYIHESDFRGTSKAAIALASQASTLVDSGRGDKRRKEHRHHGDFGPIYSENRFFIVVNVADDVFSAIPLFTHDGKGLAKTPDKKSWVSIEDHRQLGKCIQQSEHKPLRTACLSTECNYMDPVSTAWIPYAFPCRYDVPVAYQGKLDKASARRLVRLHRGTWVDDENN